MMVSHVPQGWQATTPAGHKAIHRLVLAGVLFLLLSLAAPASGAGAIRVLVPATPASIPLILAAEEIPDAEVSVFTSHTQAHSLFLRGDAQILSTGLSVGIAFCRRGVPVRMIHSYVSGLTHLITRGTRVTAFRELAGKTLYLPFEGSPIDEVTRFFLWSEGLRWKKDLPIAYAPFPAVVKMMAAGRIDAAALPEPFVSQLEGRERIHVSLSYLDLWRRHTGETGGYPQVGTLVKADWAARNRPVIHRLDAGLERAIRNVEEKPDPAIRRTQERFGFRREILRSSLTRIRFRLLRADALAREIEAYHRTVGVPFPEACRDLVHRR